MMLTVPLMHGCDNRFAIVDEDVTPIPEDDRVCLVREIACRAAVHGILFVAAHDGPRMWIFDRDGTEETMCGNGIRCAARYFRDRGRVARSYFTIATLDGPKAVTVGCDRITVDMGVARDYRRISEQRYFVFTGIPHLVILSCPMAVDAARRGARRIRHDRTFCAALGYPDGVHVNFVWPIDDATLDVLTYEVGVEDITPACGTGSTACAYVCGRLGMTSFPTRVRMLGGELGPSVPRPALEYTDGAYEGHDRSRSILAAAARTMLSRVDE